MSVLIKKPSNEKSAWLFYWSYLYIFGFSEQVINEFSILKTTVMRTILYILFTFLINVLMAQTLSFAQLHDTYEQYKETKLVDRRFKHYDIVPLIEALPKQFKVVCEGQSVEGNDIFSIHLGSGKTKVLLWSQMHGDEATATAALFDMFRFFAAKDDGFDAYRTKILKELTLVFIPMLNPDGTARFMRRNAMGVDLNREAVSLSAPEAQLLKRVRDELNAEWAFNLHDQSPYYGVGYPTKDVATLAFLAPAYNFEKSVDKSREKAMLLIAEWDDHLQKVIPNKVAKYSDAFEPRAFGDNIQKWGSNTILVESGAYPNDREKQYIRQLNYVCLLYAFESIVDARYQNYSKANYKAIPYNKYGAYNDLLIRGVKWDYGRNFHPTIDIGINYTEHNYNNARQFYMTAAVDDIGDLSYQKGFQELDAKDYNAAAAKEYDQVLDNMEAVKQLDVNALLAEGIAVVRVKNLEIDPWVKAAYPLMLLQTNETYDTQLNLGVNVPIILRKQTGKVVYAIVNGRLTPVQ